MTEKSIPRILVIDDNPDIHADFRKILAPPTDVASELANAANSLFNRPRAVAKQLCELDSASQGKEGLKMVKAALAAGRPYAVAFVDMRMPPGWDGLETIVHLWEVQPSLQVIICSAYSDQSWEDINERLNHSDRCLILKKPFDNVEVQQLASALTSRARVERELAESTRKLVAASRQAGMAEVATGVLHNVGNVLNSVNVSTGLIIEALRRSKTASLAKAVQLLIDHKDDLSDYLTKDPQGVKLPRFLETLTEHISQEQASLGCEMRDLQSNIDHIKQIVAMQQSYAKVSGVLEKVALHELVEDALRMVEHSFERHCIRIIRQFEAVPMVLVDRHKVLQVLVNLIGNAKHALEHRADERCLSLRIAPGVNNRVRIDVTDNGVGIAPENIARIFNHGFTTKKSGHGFGLHSGANAIREMGGELSVRSDGLGHGATFIIEVPVEPSVPGVPESVLNPIETEPRRQVA